jgi:hypothetical protein
VEANFTLTFSPMVPMPETVPVVTTVSCGSIRIKQFCGRSIGFLASDSSNPASPVRVAPGGEYCCINLGAGYSANVFVGSITINDTPENWPQPQGQFFLFQVLQR